MTEWIFPSNPKQYKVDEAFKELGKLEWHQTKNTKNLMVGDIVYIYLSSPIKEIHWKCKVNDVNRMTPYTDDRKYDLRDESEQEFQGPFAELEVIKEYDKPELLSFSILRQNGLTNCLMGPCRINEDLSNYIASIDE